jgi:hypothetical protein
MARSERVLVAVKLDMDECGIVAPLGHASTMQLPKSWSSAERIGFFSTLSIVNLDNIVSSWAQSTAQGLTSWATTIRQGIMSCGKSSPPV